MAADRDELRKELRKIERFERQKKELNALAEYLKKKDFDRKREYEKKLERMIRTGEVEEEIVW